MRRPFSRKTKYFSGSPFRLSVVPMPLVMLEKEGVSFCSASSSDVMPALESSREVITLTGTGLFFIRWCVPVPVTTTCPSCIILSRMRMTTSVSPAFTLRASVV